MVNRFGQRLFDIFFKTYTEKVWGMPCTEISADWASQRIKKLDLAVAIRNALLGSSATKDGEVVTTLIDEFEYPRHGPGQMWERCVEILEERGTKTILGASVVGLRHDGGCVTSAIVREGDKPEYEVTADHYLSTMPIRTLLRSLHPAPPEEVREAAERLRYRDFLTVALVVDAPELFEDNWIYIHSDAVKVGRVQNFKNWSPDMVPDSSKTALGLEYFVQEGDELWTMDDDDLIALGRKECDALGLAPTDSVLGGAVVRMPKAYPVYDGEYQEALDVIRRYLAGIENLQLIGRNGQHRYNNQDHSMVTGVYAARNILGEEYDIWDVNVEDDYHEETTSASSAEASSDKAGADRMVPQAVEVPPLEQRIREVYARFDPVALGVAIATVTGPALLLATVALLLRGGDVVGPNLSLLGNFLLGYTVSWSGALLGFVEASIGGYLLGWFLATLTNAILRYEETRTLNRVEAAHAMSLFEGDERW